MLFSLYYQLFIMSIAVIGLYLILKLFHKLTLKYFTASWHYYTYLGVYMFLLLPFHKVISLLSDLNRMDLPALPFTVDFIPLNSKTLNDSFTSLPYILLAGTAVFLLIILFKNHTLSKRIFGKSSLLSDGFTLALLSNCKQEIGVTQNVQVYLSSYASTPFLYGIGKPCIILPDMDFTTEELQHVFRHELTHWKRHDTWLKCFMLFINAVQWFNPLAYLIRREIDYYCELSCDERVVISMNAEEKRRYCELMLSILWNAANQNVNLISAFSDKRKLLERRMDMILRNNRLKNNRWIRICAIAIALALTVVGSITVYANSYTNKPVPVAGETSVTASASDTSGKEHSKSLTSAPAYVVGEQSISAPAE